MREQPTLTHGSVRLHVVDERSGAPSPRRTACEPATIGTPNGPPFGGLIRNPSTFAPREIPDPDVILHVRNRHGKTSSVWRQIDRTVHALRYIEVFHHSLSIDLSELADGEVAVWRVHNDSRGGTAGVEHAEQRLHCNARRKGHGLSDQLTRSCFISHRH